MFVEDDMNTRLICEKHVKYFSNFGQVQYKVS